LAAGLTGLFAADSSVANAQTPSPPTTRADVKAETRPGPLDLVVYFRAGGSDIDTASNSSLDQLAVWLREDRARTVFIEEHPQEASAASFDVKVGADRQDAARRYLVAHGAMDTQIRVVAHGQISTAKIGDLNSRSIFISTNGGAEGAVTGDAGIGGAGLGASASASMGADQPAPVASDTAANNTNAEPPPPAMAEPLYSPPVVKDDNDSSDDHLLTPMGMSIAVGGGVENFFDSNTRNFTDAGGTWEARLTVGTRSPLAFEAAYVGSAHNIQALGLDNDAVLLGSSVEGDARLNLTTWAVQPYLFGGIGFTHYDVVNSDFNTSSVNDNENMGHVPVGAGLGWQYGGLLLDVRGTMRAAFNDGLRGDGDGDDEIIPDEDEAPGRAELDTWNLTGRVGFEF
jgi:hypothetical protein